MNKISQDERTTLKMFTLNYKKLSQESRAYIIGLGQGLKLGLQKLEGKAITPDQVRVGKSGCLK